MEMFNEMTDEIFTKAGVDKIKNDWAYQQCVDILSGKMAMLSVTMGLSYERVEQFNKQKESLVKDLLNLKAEGKLA